jgi:hypothetical protein
MQNSIKCVSFREFLGEINRTGQVIQRFRKVNVYFNDENGRWGIHQKQLPYQK